MNGKVTSVPCFQIYELEKGRDYKLSWNYQRNSSVDGWFEFRDAITGSLLGTSGQMILGGPGSVPNNTHTFKATTSMLYVKFFRGNDYDVASGNGAQSLFIDKLTLETAEQAPVSYEQMIDVGAGINNSNALLLSNSAHKYGPEMYIPVKPGATLVSAVIKAKLVSGTVGGILEADFQLADNTPVYEKVGSNYVSLWRGSASADKLTYDDYSVTGLPTLPAQVYDVNGVPYDMAKTQFYLRVMPFIPDGNDATWFDDLVVELRENASGTKVFYTADIQQSSDYYAFGSPQVGRTHGTGYRFGYQGSEKDDEISKAGNSYTTEFRQLDSRLGRWFSCDPVFQPWQSPYVSMNNNPINVNDPTGLVGEEPIKLGGVLYNKDEVSQSATNSKHSWKNLKRGEYKTNDKGEAVFYREKVNGKYKYYKLTRIASEAEKKKEAEAKAAAQEKLDAEEKNAREKDEAAAAAKQKASDKTFEKADKMEDLLGKGKDIGGMGEEGLKKLSKKESEEVIRIAKDRAERLRNKSLPKTDAAKQIDWLDVAGKAIDIYTVLEKMAKVYDEPTPENYADLAVEVAIMSVSEVPIVGQAAVLLDLYAGDAVRAEVTSFIRLLMDTTPSSTYDSSWLNEIDSQGVRDGSNTFNRYTNTFNK